MAGHNGLRSMHQHITEAYGRVRIGIGHPGHKDRVAGYVLHDFARSDADWLDDLMRGIEDGVVFLAEGDSAKFLNAIGLRMGPPAKPKKAAKPQAAETPTQDAEPDERSKMQKLMDKFK